MLQGFGLQKVCRSSFTLNTLHHAFGNPTKSKVVLTLQVPVPFSDLMPRFDFFLCICKYISGMVAFTQTDKTIQIVFKFQFLQESHCLSLLT